MPVRHDIRLEHLVLGVALLAREVRVMNFHGAQARVLGETAMQNTRHAAMQTLRILGWARG